MPTQKQSDAPPSTLPSAPLVEVVFEIRWKLIADPSLPPQNSVDPGIFVLADAFLKRAEKFGFRHVQKLASEPMVPGHSVLYRCAPSDAEPFPLWQIGPGIFAANESSGYQWAEFKNTILKGVTLVLESYPKLSAFRIEPTQIELRYVDSFNRQFLPHSDVVQFVAEHTSFDITISDFLKGDVFENPPKANIVLTFPISGRKHTNFRLRIASAQVQDQDTIILESKVVTSSESLRVGKSPATILKFLDKWLEDAHSVTSGFFKSFVNDDLMRQFKG